jgi:catalase (peroxidase I)
MASGIYNRFKANLMNKEVDLEGDTVNVALLDGSHAFTATHNTWSEVSANEISGTGYTTDGQALANKTVTQAATTKWDADNTEWTTASFSAYHAVIYDVTATSNLICSFDFGGIQTVTVGTFRIVWHTDGIITIA